MEEPSKTDGIYLFPSGKAISSFLQPISWVWSHKLHNGQPGRGSEFNGPSGCQWDVNFPTENVLLTNTFSASSVLEGEIIQRVTLRCSKESHPE